MRSILIHLTLLISTNLLFGQNTLQADNGTRPNVSQSVGSVFYRPIQIINSDENSMSATETNGREMVENDADEPPADEDRVQYRVSVNDADGNVPIELARVALSRNGQYIADAVTNPAGQARFRDIKPGNYRITAWFVGYDTFVDSITVDKEHSSYKITLHSLGTSEKEVVVVAQRDPTSSNINPVTAN